MPGLWLIGLSLGAILSAALIWGFHRTNGIPIPTETLPNSAILPPPAAATPAQREQALINSQNLAAFSTAPFASIPLISAALEPVLGKDFREFIKPPPGSHQDIPAPDPRKLRALMDRGVVIYAGSTDDNNRQKGVELIQTAALLGYSPARRLIARNYPHSEPVRRAVPARDVISYAVNFFTSSEIDSDDTKSIFVALAEQFAGEGQIEFFTTQLLGGLRGDSRPQLSHRIDTMLELLARVRGACLAVARLVLPASGPTGDACSGMVAENLSRFVATGTPVEREPELRRRGLIMLGEAGSR